MGIERRGVIQLNPPIPLDTPFGSGLATFLIDQGIEHDLIWVVFLDENGECWSFRNREIRAQKNITMGRMANSLKTGSKITKSGRKLLNTVAKPKPSKKGKRK
jgi:hypothetical protein